MIEGDRIVYCILHISIFEATEQHHKAANVTSNIRASSNPADRGANGSVRVRDTTG